MTASRCEAPSFASSAKARHAIEIVVADDSGKKIRAGWSWEDHHGE